MTKRDVQAFIDIIPDWERYSERLKRIVLAKCNDGLDGAHELYYREETGAIFLQTWPEDLWVEVSSGYFENHQAIFDRFGLSYDQLERTFLCRFTLAQARAFMLLHVFLHELGHHYDRINQKHVHTTKGEEYAERFATSKFDQLFPKYVAVFGDPSRAF